MKSTRKTEEAQKYVFVVRGKTNYNAKWDVRHYSAHTTTEAGEFAENDGLLPSRIIRARTTDEPSGRRVYP